MHCLENTEKRVGLVWGVHSERTRERDHKVYQGKFLPNKSVEEREQKKNHNIKGWAVEWFVYGSCGIFIFGGVQCTARYGFE